MNLSDYIPPSLLKNLQYGGKDVLSKIGKDDIRDVIFQILCGLNVRSSTEILTRKRIRKICLDLLVLLLKANAYDPNFFSTFTKQASNELQHATNKEESLILKWFLGLTVKGFENILRDDPENLPQYVEIYEAELKSMVSDAESTYGALKGEISVNDANNSNITWSFLIHLFDIIGSSTLSIRGSEKSTYGKLFEKLILGSALTILGLRFITQKDFQGKHENIFWLSSKNDKRECDAIAICANNKSILFDIGFIGKGNPEISLDKVSRFERQIELSHKKYEASTIIIVDTVGPSSSIIEMAKNIDGVIIQMSFSYWVKQLACAINEKTGFKSEILDIPDGEIRSFISDKLKYVDFNQFLT